MSSSTRDPRGLGPVHEAAGEAIQDGWTLERDAASGREAWSETLFALSDGLLGVRAGLEEHPSDTDGAFLADAWEREPIDYHERFPGFARWTETRTPVADAKRIRVRLGEALVDLTDGEILSCRRSLDLRTGRLRRRTVWRAPDGATLSVSVERTACFARPGLYALKFTVASIDHRGRLVLVSEIDPGRAGAAKSDDPRIGVGVGGLRLVSTETRGRVALAVQAAERSGRTVICGQTHADGVTAASGPVIDVVLEPGEQVVLEKLVAYEVTSGADDEIATATDRLVARLQEAAKLGFEALAAEQAEALGEFWKAGAIEIAGQPELALALRLNLFHLRQAAGSSGLAAKGLTGEGYEGHIFWDAEAFMLPVLVYTAPELARAHLAWRFSRLDKARTHAREMNFARGALYPWRTIDGAECSAYFPAGSAQIHLNAAIAWAIGLYVEATDDLDFLAAMGGEMLFETARLWLQAGEFSARLSGAFSICEVTGPDEYSALVDNNYYTNRMAQRHLRLARAAFERLARERPHALAEIAQRIGLDEAETEVWARAADAMRLPHDAALGVYAQDDGFLDKPRFDFAAAQDKRPLLLHYHPLTLYRHQVCKQADVVLGHVLAGEAVSLEQKRRDYDYYQAITTHDSTLSASSFAVLAAEVGAGEAALRHFDETARVDLDNLHGNAGHGAHLAAMAGSWLVLAWGFGGLRIIDARPTFRPALPANVKAIGFGLRWKGALLHVRITERTAEYAVRSGPPLEIVHEGERLTVAPERPVERTWGKAQPLEAVIFDLDGVIADTAEAHYRGWKRLADELGLAFDAHANEALKGLDRAASLEALLGRRSADFSVAEKAAMTARKNGFYLEEIGALGPEALLPGAVTAVKAARAAGLKTALASASRNAPLVLRRLGIAGLFDAVADPALSARSKPAPDLFLQAAERLGVAPARCLAVEDSSAGIAAIICAGMTAIGMGDPAVLARADLVLSSMTEFRPRRPGAGSAPRGTDGETSPANTPQLTTTTRTR